MPDIPIRRRPPAEARERLIAAGFPGDFASAVTGTAAAGNETRQLEWQRMVSDAIILERAAVVLQRRGNDGLTARVLVRVLRRMAGGLRREARRSGG